MEFQQFDSLDEMFAFMAEAERQANERVTEEQEQVSWGSYWIRTDQGFPIFGHVFTRPELIASEIHAGGEPEEAEQTARHYDGMLERGYLFGWAYSYIEPDGELGSTHRSTVRPITEQEFEAARERGWTDA
jgi:hypothetical protein